MDNPIKLYSSRNFSELLEMLINQIDPLGQKAEINDGLRRKFSDPTNEDRFGILVQLTKELRKGDITCWRLDEFSQLLSEHGNSGWYKIESPKLLITGFDLCHQEEVFILVDIENLEKVTTLGMGEHPIMDMMIAACLLGREDANFLKPHYPSISVLERLVECFPKQLLEDSFTKLLTKAKADMITHLYGCVTSQKNDLNKILKITYEGYAVAIYQIALQTKFDELYPGDRDNETIVSKLDWEVLQNIKIDKSKKPKTLKQLRDQLQLSRM